jgi:hypothetical protein
MYREIINKVKSIRIKKKIDPDFKKWYDNFDTGINLKFLFANEEEIFDKLQKLYSIKLHPDLILTYDDGFFIYLKDHGLRYPLNFIPTDGIIFKLLNSAKKDELNKFELFARLFDWTLFYDIMSDYSVQNLDGSINEYRLKEALEEIEIIVNTKLFNIKLYK